VRVASSVWSAHAVDAKGRIVGSRTTTWSRRITIWHLRPSKRSFGCAQCARGSAGASPNPNRMDLWQSSSGLRPAAPHPDAIQRGVRILRGARVQNPGDPGRALRALESSVAELCEVVDPKREADGSPRRTTTASADSSRPPLLVGKLKASRTAFEGRTLSEANRPAREGRTLSEANRTAREGASTYRDPSSGLTRDSSGWLQKEHSASAHGRTATLAHSRTVFRDTEAMVECGHLRRALESYKEQYWGQPSSTPSSRHAQMADELARETLRCEELTKLLRDGVSYTIRVLTGGQAGAGTGCAVFALLYSETEDSGRMELQYSTFHMTPFREGQLDEFTVLVPRDIGRIQLLKIGCACESPHARTHRRTRAHTCARAHLARARAPGARTRTEHPHALTRQAARTRTLDNTQHGGTARWHDATGSAPMTCPASLASIHGCGRTRHA
jgi:hypothetical protein